MHKNYKNLNSASHHSHMCFIDLYCLSFSLFHQVGVRPAFEIQYISVVHMLTKSAASASRGREMEEKEGGKKKNFFFHKNQNPCFPV